MTIMTIEAINEWHQRARPDPTHENFGVQVGCHVEEFAEMLEAFAATDIRIAAALSAATTLANALKSGEIKLLSADREGLLDSLADQIVTAIGVGHCSNMNVPEACRRVNDSNWSKYVDGQPLFNENGKIIKGPNYQKPDLTGLY